MEYKEILDEIEKQLEGEAHLDELARKKQDPFKILISTILSARTRDANTRIATEKLFAKYNTPESIAKANIEDIEELIKSSGFYKVKAARIKEVSKILLEDYNSKVPDNYDELIELPGVGSKTANCVLVYAFKVPAIPVDTHVHRISKRLQLIPQNFTPEKTFYLLDPLIPTRKSFSFHVNLLKLGRQICLSRKARCSQQAEA